MKKTTLTTLLTLATLCTQAKSIVFTLNDRVATRVYVLLGNDENPKMVMNGDGTFTLCGRQYDFSNVKDFYISTTDYTGEKNTEDAIVSIQRDKMLMEGEVTVYTTDGKLVGKGEREVLMSTLGRGTYIITNGVSTIKCLKK